MVVKPHFIKTARVFYTVGDDLVSLTVPSFKVLEDMLRKRSCFSGQSSQDEVLAKRGIPSSSPGLEQKINLKNSMRRYTFLEPLHP